MTMAIVVCEEGIDYEAFGDQKVHVIIMVTSPTDAQGEYGVTGLNLARNTMNILLFTT